MSKPKNAVFIATTPPDFVPLSYHDVPTGILGGEFYAKRMPLHRALTVAQEFNKAHLPCKGRFAGQWAIVIKGLRRMWRPEHSRADRPAKDQQPDAQEGGAQ